MKIIGILLLLSAVGSSGCADLNFKNLEYSKNVINFAGNPASADSKSRSAFSDQGAWFGFGFLEPAVVQAGFSGPFLMTEQNGIWISPCFISLQLTDEKQHKLIDWKSALVYQNSYNSHLEQFFKNENLTVKQELCFLSGHTAIQRTMITSTSQETLQIQPVHEGILVLDNLTLSCQGSLLKISSSKSNALGYIRFSEQQTSLILTAEGYSATSKQIDLEPGDSCEIIVSQTFIFPQYSWETEKSKIQISDFDVLLNTVKRGKDRQLEQLIARMKTIYADDVYSALMAKLVLTLQTNWRIPAEGLHHAGIFPSYHYEWFHGFWAWDSWKQAAAAVQFNPELAKDQMRAMFDFQMPNGFIPDCIYRDTLIEPNNYRNTKPPLAGWAVWKIYKKTKDLNFLEEFYPKLKKYHHWWYRDRDHDQDGICEYGSTDGTTVAAKWESGMDNAVRFDNNTLLKNGDNAFSLDQESVDLNAFLYLEKTCLGKIASELSLAEENRQWNKEASDLKNKIQHQFWNDTTGWFYDTSIDGKTMNKDMGCEGWLPLWAAAATPDQAAKVRENILYPGLFNTYVPLPTLASNHPEFQPDSGYWRGPVWIDQSYFGIVGLEQYGYEKDAEKLAYNLIHHAEGVIGQGNTIRENYQPITGRGLEAYNFSWSAAHYLLLLINE